MYLSPVPCTGPVEDVVLTTASLTPCTAISGNLSDKGNGRSSIKVKKFSNFTSVLLMTVWRAHTADFSRATSA